MQLGWVCTAHRTAMPDKPSMPALDGEGFLVDPNDWTEAVATELARREGITLGEDHWDAIRFMRSFYEEKQVAADARFVIRHLEQRLGPAARKGLFRPFPYGYPGRRARSRGCAGRVPGAPGEGKFVCVNLRQTFCGGLTACDPVLTVASEN